MHVKANRGNRRGLFSRMLWAFNAEGEGGSAGGGSTSSEGTTVESSAGSATAESGYTTEYNPNQVTTPAPAATTTVDFKTRIPEAYRDKPYFANIQSEEELFKQFDGLQSKLGQRPAGLPDDAASDEDWNKYKESVRPKSADDYDFKPLDLGEEGKEVADYVNSFRDEASMKELKGLMHESGIPKKQAEELIGKLEKWQVTKFGDTFKSAAAAKAQMETDFTEKVTKHFQGDKDKALKYGAEYIQKHIPEGLKQYLGGLPNEALLMFAAAGMSEKKMYNTEDTISSSTPAQGATIPEIRAKMQEIFSSPRHKKAHPEYEQAQAELKVYSQQIANLMAKK